MSVLREKEDIRSLISGMYVDPDIIKFENKYYLYPTTDGYVNWTGTQFHVFSSVILRNW